MWRAIASYMKPEYRWAAAGGPFHLENRPAALVWLPIRERAL
jgi:hypothetical protein